MLLAGLGELVAGSYELSADIAIGPMPASSTIAMVTESLRVKVSLRCQEDPRGAALFDPNCK